MNEESNAPSYKNLLEQLELTKKQLGDAVENIRRITGRDPDQFNNDNKGGQPGLNKWKQQPGMNPSKPFIGRNKRPLFPIVKMREEQEAAEEDSPDEEAPAKKPSLLSTVVATPKDLKSRRETIKEQNVNSKVKARNRRMLGMILGTLQKFQHDAKKREEKDLKRAEIEQKVEAAAAEEKERIKREKEELFQTRREKQVQLRCLEKKLEIAELYEVWEKNQKHLANFIMTTTQPPITFLPATHTSETLKRLKESKAKVLESIKERKEKMENELLEVEKWYKKDNFPGDKENIGPIEDVPMDTSNNQETPNIDMEISEKGPEGESNELQISPEEVQSNQKLPESSVEVSVSEIENTVAETENTVACEEDSSLQNIENVKEQSDQDFEPIYD